MQSVMPNTYAGPAYDPLFDESKSFATMTTSSSSSSNPEIEAMKTELSDLRQCTREALAESTAEVMSLHAESRRKADRIAVLERLVRQEGARRRSEGSAKEPGPAEDNKSARPRRRASLLGLFEAVDEVLERGGKEEGGPRRRRRASLMGALMPCQTDFLNGDATKQGTAKKSFDAQRGNSLPSCDLSERLKLLERRGDDSAIRLRPKKAGGHLPEAVASVAAQGAVPPPPPPTARSPSPVQQDDLSFLKATPEDYNARIKNLSVKINALQSSSDRRHKKIQLLQDLVTDARSYQEKTRLASESKLWRLRDCADRARSKAKSAAGILRDLNDGIDATSRAAETLQTHVRSLQLAPESSERHRALKGEVALRVKEARKAKIRAELSRRIGGNGSLDVIRTMRENLSSARPDGDGDDNCADEVVMEVNKQIETLRDLSINVEQRQRDVKRKLQALGKPTGGSFVLSATNEDSKVPIDWFVNLFEQAAAAEAAPTPSLGAPRETAKQDVDTARLPPRLQRRRESKLRKVKERLSKKNAELAALRRVLSGRDSALSDTRARLRCAKDNAEASSHKSIRVMKDMHARASDLFQGLVEEEDKVSTLRRAVVDVEDRVRTLRVDIETVKGHVEHSRRRVKEQKNA